MKIEFVILTIFFALIMLVFGWLFCKRIPHKMNFVFGYRTKRSMKNLDCWNYAHTVCGRFWLIAGIVSLIVSIICNAIVLFTNCLIIDKILLILECCAMLSVIPYTEIMLKKFDK